MKSTRFTKRSLALVGSVRPILLLSLLVVGAVGGFTVRQLFFIKYQAKISLPLSGGELTTFRDSESLFGSAAMFEKYGIKNKISDTPDFEKIHLQFARNLPGPVRIERAFRLSRKDLRDLPEAYVKDELNRQIAAQGLMSDVYIYATAKQPEEAVRLAKLAMEYMRETLAMASFRDVFQQWGPGARTELALKREAIAKLKSDLASTNRRIESMGELRERLKSDKDIGPSVSNVQVQITGARNLSIPQQIVGLETDRAELAENLRLAEEDRLRLEILVSVSDMFAQRADDGDSIGLAKEILAYAGKPPINSAIPVERALASIGAQTQSILARFNETRSDRVVPEASPAGLGRLLAVIFGMIVGAGIWLLLLLLPARRPWSDDAT